MLGCTGGLKKVLGRLRRCKQQKSYCQLPPEKLETLCRPVFQAMLDDIGYEGAPAVEDQAKKDVLLEAMNKKVHAHGMTLDDPVGKKGFTLGFSLALLGLPDHPLEVQVYVGIFTWLVVQIDDNIRNFKDEVSVFQERFVKGEEQSLPVLKALAATLHEAYDHWDPILASLMITSCMNFVTSNLLDERDEYKCMPATTAGTSFPYYFRHLSGITEAYAIFTFPKALYPDMTQFFEAIPDMALFINIANDVVSFYKEELAGETANYIHNRAKRERKNPLAVVKDVAAETVACVGRVDAILAGRGPYAAAWKAHMRGQIAMHTVNPRYRMAELGLGEEHPLRDP